MSGERHLNPYRDETDEAIIEVFSTADEVVLLTKEIWPEVVLSERQTLRRLEQLESRGVLASKETTQDRIWWLDAKVEEPITVKYPLLKVIRRRFDFQLILAGVGLGFIGAFCILLFMGLEGSQVPVSLISRDYILVSGLYSIAIGVSMTCGGIGALLLTHLLRRLGIGGTEGGSSKS